MIHSPYRALCSRARRFRLHLFYVPHCVQLTRYTTQSRNCGFDASCFARYCLHRLETQLVRCNNNMITNKMGGIRPPFPSSISYGLTSSMTALVLPMLQHMPLGLQSLWDEQMPPSIAGSSAH